MRDYQEFLSTSAGLMRESGIRQMGRLLAGRTDIVSFAPGYPAEEAFPWHAFSEIAREALDRSAQPALQYGPTRGLPPLREVVVGLMKDRGIESSVSDVVMTTGSQQGLDLVARTLIDPGDVVLLELPSYTGAIMAFRNAGATMVGVRQADDGIDLDDLRHTLATVRADGRRVKFLYVVPNFQNPTGLLLGLARRLELVEWARREGILIVEDDPYRDLYFEDSATETETRPVAAYAGSDGPVIYLSSFSKTLAPGLRVGWIAAPQALAAKLEIAKQSGDMCSGGLDQLIVYEACRRGVLAEQLPRLRRTYQGKRDALVAALDDTLAGRLSWPHPRGGFFLWARLAPPVTSQALLPFALSRGVVYVSGHAFYVDGSGDEYLRLSFSAPSIDQIELGVTRLAAALDDALAAR